MIRKLFVLFVIVIATAGMVWYVPPSNSSIIWLGMTLIALSVTALVGLFAAYRYQAYVGIGILFCLYLQWQHIMSFELVGYALLGIVMSEVIYFVLRKLW